MNDDPTPGVSAFLLSDGVNLVSLFVYAGAGGAAVSFVTLAEFLASSLLASVGRRLELNSLYLGCGLAGILG